MHATPRFTRLASLFGLIAVSVALNGGTARAETPGPTASCAGPARADLTAGRVAGMLQSDDEYPIAAIKKLGAGAVPALVELATGWPERSVRQRATSLLGDLGCRATAPTIRKNLADKDPLVRLSAVSAYQRLLGAEATPALAAMLSDGDAGVVKFAIKGLEQSGDGRALPALARVTRAQWLRDRATTAIAKIRARTVEKR